MVIFQRSQLSVKVMEIDFKDSKSEQKRFFPQGLTHTQFPTHPPQLVCSNIALT